MGENHDSYIDTRRVCHEACGAAECASDIQQMVCRVDFERRGDHFGRQLKFRPAILQRRAEHESEEGGFQVRRAVVVVVCPHPQP